MYRNLKLLIVAFMCLALVLSPGYGSAESAELQIEQQEDAYLGCEVVLSLTGDAARASGAVFEWTFEGNAKPIHLRKGGMECRFTPIDTSPVNASVAALDASGNTIATADISVTAKEFGVEIAMVESDPFMIWDANAKKEVATDSLIAGEPIRFKVNLTPEFKKEIKYEWHTDASTAIKDGASKPEVTVVRNEIGDAGISVVVADTNGTVLGRGSKTVNVPISRAMLEDSSRRHKAWNLWTEAQNLWESKNFDEAVKVAHEAAETDAETAEISDGLKAMNANFTRVERARTLTANAAAMHGEQKLADALRTYRHAYAAWAMPETEKSIKDLEVEINNIRERRQRAEWIKDTAAAYDQEGFFDEALKLYREMLALQPDQTVEERASRIEKRLGSMAKAKTFTEEGQKLEAEGKIQQAVEKYRESVKMEANPTLETHARELEDTIKERRARAATLRKEGSDLQRKNKNAEALVRYRESQALWPDDDLAKRIADLERTVTEAPKQAVRSAEDFGIGTQADANRLRQEGNTLYKQGKYREALAEYRKSYAISKDQRLAAWISRVETSLNEYEAVQKANSLIKEANALYNDSKYVEALAKYKESLAIHPNTEVESFTKHIESALSSADAKAVSQN